MTAENNFQETKKAGILNTVVSVVTLGKYGVDETVAYGLKDDMTGEIFQGSPTQQVLKTRRSVSVGDVNKTTHVLKREIVKRK